MLFPFFGMQAYLLFVFGGRDLKRSNDTKVMSYYDWHPRNNYGCVIGSTNSSQAKEFQMHYSFEKKKERIFSSVKKCM